MSSSDKQTSRYPRFPGRPVSYGTTPHFLRSFGLASVGELPLVPQSGEEETELEGQVRIEETQS